MHLCAGLQACQDDDRDADAEHSKAHTLTGPGPSLGSALRAGGTAGMPQLGLLGTNWGRPTENLTEPGLLLGVGLRAPGAWSQRAWEGRA